MSQLAMMVLGWAQAGSWTRSSSWKLRTAQPNISLTVTSMLYILIKNIEDTDMLLVANSKRIKESLMIHCSSKLGLTEG